MHLIAKESLLLDSQHPDGLAKIQQLEAPRAPRQAEPEEAHGPPRFTSNLTGTTRVMERAAAHFETRVEPTRDPNLKVTWYDNFTWIFFWNRLN